MDASLFELAALALVVLIISMSKGGFPVGDMAVPVLIMVWPGTYDPTKTAVAFLLPLLCVMDVLALFFLRRHINWRRVWDLMPASFVGIGLGALLILPQQSRFVLPDRGLKLFIGVMGLVFVLHRWWRVTHPLVPSQRLKPGGWLNRGIFGVAGGFISTAYHGAGPIMRMYFLPLGLPKMEFAATAAAYFWAVNLIKVAPYAYCGRIRKEELLLALPLLVFAPIGVWLGYWLVRVTREEHYRVFIYLMLIASSLYLVASSLWPL